MAYFSTICLHIIPLQLFLQAIHLRYVGLQLHYDGKYFFALSVFTAVTHFAMVGLARLIELVI